MKALIGKCFFIVNNKECFAEHVKTNQYFKSDLYEKDMAER